MEETLFSCPKCDKHLYSDMKPVDPDYFVHAAVWIAAECRECGWSGEIGYEHKEDLLYWDEQHESSYTLQNPSSEA